MNREPPNDLLLRWDTRPRFLFLILLALLIVRWWLGTLPGYGPDLTAYKQWALIAGTEGVHNIFDRSTYDYPPLYAYLLAPVGWLYAVLAPEATREFAATRMYGDSAVFSVLVKLPPMAFDILIAFVAGILAWRFGLWDALRPRRGWSAALLYLCLPPVLFNSGYWGQPDAVHAFSILLGLTLILVGKAEWGWVAAALACLMKPLAVPFLPLLACATLARSGWRRLATGIGAALATAAVVMLPFVLTGRGGLVIQRLFRDVGLMPYTSVNAHNLWWLLAPWRPADRPWLGPLTPTACGLALFGIAYVLILAKVYLIERELAGRPAVLGRGAQPLSEQKHWYLAAAGVAWAFFTFSTHMHENHLFALLPFLVLLAGSGRRWLWLCLFAAGGVLINMALHDLYLGEQWFRHWGGQTTYFHPDLKRMLSRFELTLSIANSVLLLALFALFLAWGARHRPAGASSA